MWRAHLAIVFMLMLVGFFFTVFQLLTGANAACASHRTTQSADCCCLPVLSSESGVCCAFPFYSIQWMLRWLSPHCFLLHFRTSLTNSWTHDLNIVPDLCISQIMGHCELLCCNILIFSVVHLCVHRLMLSHPMQIFLCALYVSSAHNRACLMHVSSPQRLAPMRPNLCTHVWCNCGAISLLASVPRKLPRVFRVTSRLTRFSKAGTVRGLQCCQVHFI